jgi:hypothetical protein
MKCANCHKFVGKDTKELCLCLLCGETLCNINCDLAVKAPIGFLNQHANSFHGGSSIFVGVSYLIVYSVCSPHNAMDLETLYVD